MSGNDQGKVQSSCSSNLVTLTLSSPVRHSSSSASASSSLPCVSKLSSPPLASGSVSCPTKSRAASKRPTSSSSTDALTPTPATRLSKQHMLELTSPRASSSLSSQQLLLHDPSPAWEDLLLADPPSEANCSQAVGTTTTPPPESSHSIATLDQQLSRQQSHRLPARRRTRSISLVEGDQGNSHSPPPSLEHSQAVLLGAIRKKEATNAASREEEACSEDMGPPSKRHKVGNSSSVEHHHQQQQQQQLGEHSPEEGATCKVGASGHSSSSPGDSSNASSSSTANGGSTAHSGPGATMEMYGGINRISVIGTGHDNGAGSGNGGGGANDFEDDEPRSGTAEARFLVSSRDAGAIIGRGGSNITHLRQAYDSSITVPDCPSPERVLTVVASIEKVGKIVREILKYIETRPHALGTAPGRFDAASGSSFGKGGGGLKSPRNLIGLSGASSASNYNAAPDLKDRAAATEIRILLHTSHAGGLIGKGGLRITQLREETHAGIKVYSECAPQSSERVCVIYGPLEIVVGAVKAVLYLIAGFPMKGPNMLYDPRHYDQYLSPMYGGFSDLSQPPNGPPGGGQAGGGGGGAAGGGASLGISQVTPPPPQSSSQQRNPYFQASLHSPPGLGSTDALAGVLAARHRGAGGNSNNMGGGGGSGRNSFSIGGSGSRGYGNHHHASSGLLSPINGPRGFKMDPDQGDLFTPDFGGTFTGGGGGGGGALQSGNIPWSSARSYASSRRSSVSAGTGGGGGGGLDVFAPSEIDWLNYPGAAAKSWETTGAPGTVPSSSILLQQLLTREDVDIMSNIDGTAIASISVPNKIVGAIIGRGGQRISEIRMKTHADIAIGQISKSSMSPNRMITIKGALPDVQAAALSIVKCIDETH